MKYNKVTVTCYYAYDGQDLGRFGMQVLGWNHAKDADGRWYNIKQFDFITKFLKSAGYKEQYRTYNSLVDRYDYNKRRSMTVFYKLEK